MESIPLIFKIIYGLSAFMIISGLMKYCTRNKIANLIQNYPEQRKEKIVRSYVNTLKVYKIMFWLSPVYLIIVPYIIYIYDQKDFTYLLIAMFFIYIYTLLDFFLRKSILSKIPK